MKTSNLDILLGRRQHVMKNECLIIDKLLVNNNYYDLHHNPIDSKQNVFLFGTKEQSFVVASFIDMSNQNYDESSLQTIFQAISKHLPKESVIQLSFIHEGYIEFKKLSVYQNKDLDITEKAELMELINHSFKTFVEQQSKANAAIKKPLLVKVKIPTTVGFIPEESKKLIQFIYDKLKNYLMADISQLNKDQFAVHHLI